MKITFQFWTLPCKNIMLTLDAYIWSLMNVRTLQKRYKLGTTAELAEYKH